MPCCKQCGPLYFRFPRWQHGVAHGGLGQYRRAELEEAMGIAAQLLSGADGDTRGAGIEPMRAIEQPQSRGSGPG